TLVIRACTNLASIASLGGLTSLGGTITVRDNPVLTSLIGLENLSTPPGGAITIYNNSNLTDISAINYGNLNGTLEITLNPSLTSLGTLTSITSITGKIKISDNNALTEISGLSGLTSVDGNIEILNNGALTDISGLSGLTSATGGLFVRNNSLLANLSGLDNLTSLGGALDVQNNTALRDLCGLNALVASTNYTSYTVTGNGYNPLESDFPTNCSDPSLSTESFETLKVSFYPNPVTGNKMTLEVDKEGIYSMFNVNGQLVKKDKLIQGENVIDITKLNTGLYFLLINDYLGASKSVKVLKN
ncbi:MAG: T9SS type A sorting domain-containing protein, partial [Ignavibacteriae bacterium]|nr:T9SS type A sorting domain-containing protein [Ignavibacteriota bacterium]